MQLALVHRESPPDPAPWAEIPDPGRRSVAALAAMYEYYDRGRDMLENVLRDATLVPALEEILRLKWLPLMEGFVEILAEGWSGPDVEDAQVQPARQARDVELRASLRVALDFFTWRTLAASGLSNDEAARLAAVWVKAGRTSPL